MEKAERVLYRYGSLKNSINECKEDIKELYAEKYSCVDEMLRPPRLGTESKRPNGHSDPVYKVVQKMVDIYDARIAKATAHLRSLCLEYDELKEKIRDAGLSKEEREYVEMRYVRGLYVGEVVRAMNYSERQTQRLRRNVIRSVGNVV